MTDVMKMNDVTEMVEVPEVPEVPDDWDTAHDDAGCRVQPNYFYDLPLELQNYITGRFVFPKQIHQAVCDLGGLGGLAGMDIEDRTPEHWREFRAELDHENQIEDTRDCRPRDMTLTEHITLDLHELLSKGCYGPAKMRTTGVRTSGAWRERGD